MSGTDCDAVFAQIRAAHLANDINGVLKWKGRLEELLEQTQDDATRDYLLCTFAQALIMGAKPADHLRILESSNLEERRIAILGRMQRFRDQGQ